MPLTPTATLVCMLAFYVAFALVSTVICVFIERSKATPQRKLFLVNRTMSFAYLAAFVGYIAADDWLNPAWIVSRLVPYGIPGIALTVLASVLSFMILYLIMIAVRVHFTKRLRGTTRGFGRTMLSAAFSLFFNILSWVFVSLGYELSGFFIHDGIARVAAVFAWTALVLGFGYLVQRIGYSASGERDRDREAALFPELSAFAESVGVRFSKLYYLKTGDARIANAMAIGILRPAIGIFSHLHENVTDGEFKAVMAHELGHIRHRHSLARWLVVSVAAAAALFAMDFVSSLLPEFGRAGGTLVRYAVLILFIAYLPGFIYRFQERQADLFAAKATGDAAGFVSALWRIQALNDGDPATAHKRHALTHPALMQRVEHLERKLGLALPHEAPLPPLP